MCMELSLYVNMYIYVIIIDLYIYNIYLCKHEGRSAGFYGTECTVRFACSHPNEDESRTATAARRTGGFRGLSHAAPESGKQRMIHDICGI